MALAFVLASLGMPATAWADPAGLVAAYSFDEGSGHDRRRRVRQRARRHVVGATWVTGRYGGGLSFNGTNDYVGPPAPRHVLQHRLHARGLGAEDRARPRTTSAIFGTWNGGGGPMLWVDHIADRYHLTLGNSLSTYLDSGLNPIAGQWQHLAATYDGTTARYLHRRHRSRQPPRLGQHRQLQHLANRRLRPQPRRLLRRPDRRHPDLQPHPHRRGDPPT